jgi:hypothetical protein
VEVKFCTSAGTHSLTLTGGGYCSLLFLLVVPCCKRKPRHGVPGHFITTKFGVFVKVSSISFTTSSFSMEKYTTFGDYYLPFDIVFQQNDDREL